MASPEIIMEKTCFCLTPRRTIMVVMKMVVMKMVVTGGLMVYLHHL